MMMGIWTSESMRGSIDWMMTINFRPFRWRIPYLVHGIWFSWIVNDAEHRQWEGWYGTEQNATINRLGMLSCQRLHREAEIASMLDARAFGERARELYGYPHFVCDTGGSICDQSPMIRKLAFSAVLI